MTTIEKVPSNLVVDFDVYDPDLAIPTDTMHERVAELAAIGPVVFSPAYGGHWIVTHYKEIQEVLTAPQTFSSYPNNLVTSDIGKFIPLELDPPEHSAYRQALQPLFSPQRMKKLSDDIRVVVNELIDVFAAKGEAEWVSEFAHELPARVFLSLMDWPLADAPMFSEATDTILFGKPEGTEEESNQARMMAGLQMFAYFQNIVEDRRANPGEDITSTLVHSEVKLPDGNRLLTDEELNRMFFLLLIGGLHTVQGSLSWSILHLSNHPDQRDDVIADPGMIPAAVEEILRYDAAIVPGRRATEDVDLGGVSISKDDQLVLMLCGANRDGAEFTEPTSFNIERQPNRHLSFGAGPHRCLGSHLGRVELNIALQELHRRIPDYQLIENDPPVFHASQVRGCKRMPIKFTPEK